MKKPLFILGMVVFFTLGCEKKVINPSAQPATQSFYADSSGPDKPTQSDAPSTKSHLFPTFNMNSPVVLNDSSTFTEITTYFEQGFTNTDSDYWAIHEFKFDDVTTEFVYHYFKVNNDFKSEVYSMDGKYQFTYVDQNGKVSVVYDNSDNPQEMGPVWDCVKDYIMTYPEGVIIYGAAAITFWTRRCYRMYGQNS